MRKLPSILLVDDDSTSIFLTQRLLDRLAVADQVLAAPNGAEGLLMLQLAVAEPAAGDATPWLVLLDLNMPVLDGFGFLAAYQCLPAAQRLRVAVVVLTTSLHEADLERLQRLPISGLVTKPLTEEKVNTILQESIPVLPAPESDPAGGVFQLLYRSRAVRPLTEQYLYRLLSQSRQANAVAQITGVLVHQGKWFVQLLEGPEANVQALYARIQQDLRHTEVVTVAQATERPRCFAAWRMALGKSAEPNVALLFAAALAFEASDLEERRESLLRDACAALVNSGE